MLKMAKIKFKQKGDFSKTFRFMDNALKEDYMSIIERYAELGVDALRKATPKDSGKTAESWFYVINKEKGRIVVSFENSNVVKGVNIAIILQYGHGTRNGGYVVGRDYINPAMQPIFDKIADEAWNEVVSI